MSTVRDYLSTHYPNHPAVRPTAQPTAQDRPCCTICGRPAGYLQPEAEDATGADGDALAARCQLCLDDRWEVEHLTLGGDPAPLDQIYRSPQAGPRRKR